MKFNVGDKVHLGFISCANQIGLFVQVMMGELILMHPSLRGACLVQEGPPFGDCRSMLEAVLSSFGGLICCLQIWTGSWRGTTRARVLAKGSLPQWRASHPRASTTWMLGNLPILKTYRHT